jgi:uncharacterized OB-fold protein
MATPYEKPLPVVDAESKPYWDAARQHRLTVQRCQECKAYFFYPRALCPKCHGDRVTWETVSGEGTVYSFTIARRPAGPAFKADVPYVVALIELSEGARILSNLVTRNVDAVRIGDRVRVVFDDVTPEITLPKFEPAD